MTISRHAAGSITAVTSTTASPTIPTNSVGDILIFTLVTAGTPTSGPSGWNLLGSSTTVTSAKVYVWGIAVSSVMSGTATATMSASSVNRAQITSYSGVDTNATPLAVATSGTTASTAITSGSATFGDYVFWANGRSAASTLSGETASAGTWTASEAIENSGTNAMTVVDGPITAGTTASLSATSSASITWNSLVLVLMEPATPTTGAAALDYELTATAANVQPTTGAVTLGQALSASAANVQPLAAATITRHAAGGVVSSTGGTIAAAALPANSTTDILLAALTTNATSVNPPSGWTLVASDLTNTGGKVHVYWSMGTGTTVGTPTWGVVGATASRLHIDSYSGASNQPPTLVATGGSTTASTAMVSPSLDFADGFVYWVNGRATGSVTMSGEAASAGTWTPSETNESTGSSTSMTVTDGPITRGTTASLTATASANALQGNVVISIPAATVPTGITTGPSALTYTLSATAAIASNITTGDTALTYALSATASQGIVGPVSLNYSLAGTASTTAKATGASALTFTLSDTVSTTEHTTGATALTFSLSAIASLARTTGDGTLDYALTATSSTTVKTTAASALTYSLSSTERTIATTTAALGLGYGLSATDYVTLTTTASTALDFSFSAYANTTVPVTGATGLTFSLSAAAGHVVGLNQTGIGLTYTLGGSAYSWITPLELGPFFIEVWDKHLARCQAIGDPVYATVTTRWPGTGNAEIQLKVTDAANAFLQQPGARITVQYRGEHLFSGWVSSYQGAMADTELVTYQFTDDYTAVPDTLGWVVPTGHLAATATSDEAQTVLLSGTHTAGAADGVGYYDWTPITPGGSCSPELAIKRILGDNWTRLGAPISVVTSASRGGSITKANLPQVRFDPLDTIVEPLASTGNLRIKVWQPRFSSTLFMDVVPLVTWPQVLTYEGGVVQSGDYSIQAPAATRVVVGGPGQDTARAFDQQINTGEESDWGRKIEVFKEATNGVDTSGWPSTYTTAQQVDKYYPVDTNVASASRAAFTAALQAVAADQLNSASATSGLDITLSETASFHYGGSDGFHVGDTLTVSAGGVTFNDTITECTLSWTASGFTVTPTVGSKTADPDVLLLQSIQALATSLRQQATGR